MNYKKIEKAAVIAVCALAIVFLLRTFWKNQQKRERESEQNEAEVTLIPTDAIANNDVTPTATPNAGEESTPTPTPTPDTGYVEKIPGVPETMHALTPTTTIPTATPTPEPIDTPTPAIPLPTKTPEEEWEEQVIEDEKLIQAIWDEGYEQLWYGIDPSWFYKTTTEYVPERGEYRQRKEYLFTIDRKVVMYEDTYYKETPEKPSERHVYYTTDFPKGMSEPTTVFRSHLENGEMVVDILFPDGTTPESIIKEIDQRADAGEFEWDTFHDCSFENKRVRAWAIRNDLKPLFTLALTYTDTTILSMLDVKPYREYNLFLCLASEDSEYDDDGNIDGESRILLGAYHLTKEFPR